MAIPSGFRHAKSGAVVHVHRGDAHALVLGQVRDGNKRLVLQIGRVVTERGHRRGVRLDVQRRLHEVAANDARPGLAQVGGGRQGHAHGNCEHECRAENTPAHVDRGARAAPEGILCPCRAGAAHQDVLPQRDALVLSGCGPPRAQERPPQQDRPHGQRVA